MNRHPEGTVLGRADGVDRVGISARFDDEDKSAEKMFKKLLTQNTGFEKVPLHTEQIPNKTMRTKTLLLLAAAAAASTIATNAQVYSVNAVGYVNKTVPAKGYAMISNPLNASPDNKINTVLTGLPDGFQMFVWNTTGKKFDIYQYIAGAGWDGPNADTLTLSPGQGAFMRNPTANPVTITFVGEVPTGPLTVNLQPGLQIVSSPVPQAGKLEDLGFGLSAESATSGPKDGDLVYKWDGTKYVIDSYIATAGWDAGLSFDVGEAFFLSRKAAGSWTRTFTVN